MGSFSRKLFSDNSLLFIIIIFSIIIDLMNGYFRNILGVELPIGIAFRGFIIVMLFGTLFAKTKSVFRIIFIVNFVLFIIACISWIILQNEFNFVGELQQISKIFYLYLFLIYIDVKSKSFKINQLVKLGVLWGLIACGINIVCFITGTGIKSYGENFGFGVKAFFNAGNDFGLAAIMCLLLACLNFSIKKSLKSFISLLIIAVGGMLIGSRAVLISVPVILIIFFFYIAFINDKEFNFSKKIKYIIGSGSLIAIVYAIIQIVRFLKYFVSDGYLLNRMSVDGLKGARTSLTDAAIDSINNFNTLEFFLGRSFWESSKYVGNYLNLYYPRMVEADGYELVSSYGWLFGGCIFLLYIILYCKSIVCFIKKRNLFSLIILFGITIIFWHSLLAGHVVFNAMLVPFLGIFYCLMIKGNYNYRK